MNAILEYVRHQDCFIRSNHAYMLSSCFLRCGYYAAE